MGIQKFPISNWVKYQNPISKEMPNWIHIHKWGHNLNVHQWDQKSRKILDCDSRSNSWIGIAYLWTGPKVTKTCTCIQQAGFAHDVPTGILIPHSVSTPVLKGDIFACTLTGHFKDFQCTERYILKISHVYFEKVWKIKGWGWTTFKGIHHSYH